ncbi:hypothetical protein [Paenibacillus terrae]|uniref:hypothetical protein n=1 Tax=Paenibacillus terrae TaxID=159743 RepID=UPI000697D639|nr:hypothetical protein [Paenibacillus terrae]
MQQSKRKETPFIFQKPMTLLNPLFTIGNQLVEMIMLHLQLKKKAAAHLAIQMLDKVGIRERLL